MFLTRGFLTVCVGLWFHYPLLSHFFLKNQTITDVATEIETLILEGLSEQVILPGGSAISPVCCGSVNPPRIPRAQRPFNFINPFGSTVECAVRCCTYCLSCCLTCLYIMQYAIIIKWKVLDSSTILGYLYFHVISVFSISNLLHFKCKYCASNSTAFIWQMKFLSALCIKTFKTYLRV